MYSPQFLGEIGKNLTVLCRILGQSPLGTSGSLAENELKIIKLKEASI